MHLGRGRQGGEHLVDSRRSEADGGGQREAVNSTGQRAPPRLACSHVDPFELQGGIPPAGVSECLRVGAFAQGGTFSRPPSSVRLWSPPPTQSLHLAISSGARPPTELPDRQNCRRTAAEMPGNCRATGRHGRPCSGISLLGGAGGRLLGQLSGRPMTRGHSRCYRVLDLACRLFRTVCLHAIERLGRPLVLLTTEVNGTPAPECGLRPRSSPASTAT